MARKLWLLWVPIALFPACFFEETYDDLLVGHTCEATDDCVEGWSCVDDVCVMGAPDAGSVDAGAADAGRVDAGAPDAGFDAGSADAGYDAGAMDAGSDAGPPPNEAPVVESATTFTDGVNVTLQLQVSDDVDTMVDVSIVWQAAGLTEVVSIATGVVVNLAHSYARAGAYSGEVFATDGEGAQGNVFSFSPVAALPSTGLLLHMKFDGNLNDQAGNTVTSSGTIDYTDDRHGFGSRAVDMRGTGGADEVPLLSVANLAQMTESFTMAVWVSPVINGLSNRRVIGQGNWMNINSPNSNPYFMELDGLSPAASGIQVGGTAAPLGQWRFLVGVVEELDPGVTRVTLYRDSVVDETVVYSVNLDNPGACRFYIGSFPRSDLCTDTQADEFSGLDAYVDDVRVFNRALTADEISALFFEGQ